MTSKSMVVDRLIELLDQGDEVDRCYAAQALGAIADPRAHHSLYKHLQDEDLDVCVDAAMALGKLRGEEASQGLVDALNYHGAGDVKLAAAQALHSCGGETAMQALRPLVLERPEEMGMGDSEGWDDWWDLQLEAVKAMGTHGYQSSIADILSLLDDEDNQDIETEALKALAMMGEAGVQTLRARLSGASARTQRRVASALGYATDEGALVLLRELLASELAEVRESGCRALAKRADSEAVEMLAPLLIDEDASVQVAALETLSRLSADVVDQQTCIDLLASESARVRETLLRLLNKSLAGEGVADAELAALCESSLQSESSDEAVAACQLLGVVGSEDNVAILVDLLVQTDQPVLLRCQALQALGALGCCNEVVLARLLECTNDPLRAVRHAALRTLLQLQASETDEAVERNPLQLIHDMLTGWEPEVDAEVINDSEVAPVSPEVADESDVDLINTVMVDDSGEPLSADGSAESEAPSLQSILDGMSNSYPQEQESAFSSVAESTLDAITRSNAEATVTGSEQLSDDSERIMKMVEDLPEELVGFADVVQQNARTGERMLNKKQSRRGQSDDDKRILAAQVLADAPDEQTVNLLLSCLMDENAELRQQSVDSLGMIARRQPSLEGLSNCLGALVTQMNAGTEEMRMACARTLGAIGHKSAIKPLFGALQDSDTLVRIQAIRSLVAIEQGSGRALTENDHVLLDEITPTRIIKAIRECHTDAEIGVRTAVMEALAALKYPDVELIVTLGLEDGGALSDPAARALGQMNAQAATEYLLKGLDNSNGMTRRLAVQILATLHGEKAA